MNLYEFIQPSDDISFYAEDDDVAFAADEAAERKEQERQRHD